MLEISLRDFPEDVYILLKEGFRANFFKTAWKINRSYRHLAKKMGFSNPTMLSWKRGKQNKQDQFCSFGIIKRIFELSKNSGEWRYTYEDIEKSIEKYRAIHGSLKVNKPILPIEDSIELREIFTHLLCDGTAQNIKMRTCKYDNKSKEAVEEFKNELSCFGDLSTNKITKIWNKQRGYFMYRYSFPKAIAKILLNRFKIKFDWKCGRIPKEFFVGKRELLIAIVRAFLIDEGGIDDTKIYFTSGNINLLKDLMKICNLLGYECRKITISNQTYCLSLSSKSYKKVYIDIIKIGKLPIISKHDRLGLGLKLINNRFDFSEPNELNEEILKALSNKQMDLVELSKKLVVRRNVLWKHVNQLKEKGMIEYKYSRIGKGGSHIWGIKH